MTGAVYDHASSLAEILHSRLCRVWEDVGEGVLICREEEYQRAIREHNEANCSGFPKEDVIEVHNSQFAKGAWLILEV